GEARPEPRERPRLERRRDRVARARRRARPRTGHPGGRAGHGRGGIIDVAHAAHLDPRPGPGDSRRVRRSTKIWRNWSRTATAQPAHRLAPRDEDDVATAVRLARDKGLAVRAVGGGHSFTPAAATDGILLNLDRLDQVEHV